MTEEVSTTNSDDAPAEGKSLDQAIEDGFAQAVKEQSGGTTEGEQGASETPPEPQAEDGEGESAAATQTTEPKSEGEGEEPKLELKGESTTDPKTLTPEQLQAAQEAVIIEALRQDPINTVRQLAQMAGFKIEEPGSETPKTPAQVQEQKDDLKEELTSALGEEITEKLLPTLNKIIDGRVKVVTEPYVRAQEFQLQKAVEKETAKIIDKFTEKHPDWRNHEKDMVALAEKFKAAPGTDELEYMEFLYGHITNKVSKAEAIKAEAERVNKAAAASGTNPQSTVPASSVAVAPPKAENFDDALERGIRAAIRGERFAIEED